METKHEADNESLRGNGLPMRYLRLLAPPLQLLSATMWQVVQQGLVDHYGMLEEFVAMVTELVPELMSYSQRAQLILGLRARLVLEMCRREEPVDVKDIESHLNRIKAPVSTTKDHHETINRVEKSEVNFVELVHLLLKDPSKRSSFFEEVFPEYYGPKYDTALEMLVWEFITRLEELLPAPDFTQLAALLGDAPCLLEDCLQSFFAPDDMKAVVEHHRNLGFFEEKESRLLPMDDCILSALSVPSETKPVPDTALLELKGHSEAGERRTSSRQLQNRNDGKTNNHLSANTVDLTSSTETEDGLSTENGHSQISGGRVLRKRKRPGVVDIPSKQPTKASPHLNSSVNDDSGDSPLISIWGDYTDSPNTSTGSDTNERKWSDEETLILLDVWGMNTVNQAQRGCLKNRQMCAQISQKLAELGFRRTAEQCQSRIKRLKRFFFRINKGNTKVDCKFYDKLKRILTSDATCGAEEVDDEDDLNEMEEDLQFITQNMPLDISPEMVSSPGRTAWTDCETLVLINTWGENKAHLGLKGGQTTAQMFNSISKNMALLGFFRTPEQCQARIKRLRAMFKQCNENNAISGVEECKFYNELARVLVNDHSIDEEVDKALEELKDDDLSSYFNQDLDAVFNIQEERKKVQWSDKETVLLLELWGDPQVQQNLKRFPHNTPVYNDIAEKLAVHGYRRSADQCYTRIKRLKATYRHCLDKSIKGSDKSDFKFYHILEKILDNQPSTSSTKVMDSIEISEDSMSNSVPETDGDFTENTAVVWSDEEVRTLIDIWAEEEHKHSMKGDLHNGEIFTNISDKMVALGYSKTLEQCCLKVKELKNYFQQCYDRKKAGQKVEYRFYNQLEPILGQELLIDDPDEERDPGIADSASTVWTHSEILAFLGIWAAHDTQQILKSSFRNGPVYADISGKMAVLGYQRTAEQCHDQITRLKKNYRRYCRGGTRRSVFPYYHIMAPVLGGFVNADGTDSNPEGFMDKDLDACEQPSTSQNTSDQGRKSTWSDQETRLLLKIWGEDRIQLAIKGSTKNRHVYDHIANAMSANGFTRNTEQCYTRIKRLKAGYHHEKKQFRYYKEMEEILKKVPKADTSFEDGSLPELSFTDMSLTDISLLEDPDPNKGVWTGDGTKVIWSDRETKILLDIWASGDIQENLKGNTKNKHLFDQISKAMLTQGYMRSADQCQSRIKRLRANFRSFLDGRKGSKHECKFFDLLMRAFGSKCMNSGPSVEDGYNSVQDLGPAEGGAEYGGFYISSPYSHKGDSNIQ